jgi:hypothetical protein
MANPRKTDKVIPNYKGKISKKRKGCYSRKYQFFKKESSRIEEKTYN